MKFITKRILPVLLVLAVLASFLVTPASAAWYKDSKGWYFLNAQGQRVKNTWQKDSVGWCYLDASGYMVENDWVLSGGKWYFMDKGGAMVSNQWRKDSKGWCWLGADGAMATNTWVQDSKGWCYVEADGYCATNTWKRDSVGWCYLDSEGSMVYNKWIQDGNKWYYVGSTGYMVDNDWVLSGGKWYFMDKGGAMVSNQWRKDSKGWCWLGADGAMATNTWVKDSKGWCYVEADGYCATNTWKRDSVGWCYLDSEGSMIKNDWVLSGGKWYYLNGEGYMVTGWQNVGADRYYFYTDGSMAENTTIDGVIIGADGKAQQSGGTQLAPDPNKPEPAPETARLTIGLPMNAYVLSLEDNALTNYLEEQTGYDIEFVCYASNSTDMATQIATTIAAGQKLPDIILGCNLNANTINRYGQDGYFLDLTNYFRDATGASENFWVRANEDLTEEELQQVLNAITDPETGSIYAVPTVERYSSDNRYQPYINQTWLDKLGLKMPTNTTELYEVLVAFRDQDPNGNGLKDETPMIGASSVSGGDVVSWLVNTFTYCDPSNPYQCTKYSYSDLTASFADDNYRMALQFVNKLCDENLLSPLYASLGSADLRSHATPASGTATCGVIVGNVDLFAAADSPVLYEYAAMPLWGYAVAKPITAKANVFITADCDEPSAAFKLLMELWSEEGSARVRYGEYGVNWVEADPDATSAYGLEADYKVISDLTGRQHTATWGVTASCFLPYADGENVQADNSSEWTAYKNQLKANTYKNFKDAAYNNPYYVGPTSLMKLNNLENADSIRSDITSIVNRALNEFVTGSRDPYNDAAWNAYLSELNNAGLADYVAAMTESYKETWNCNGYYGHFYTFANCTDGGYCVFCYRGHSDAHGHKFEGENCAYCGAGIPNLTDGRWRHDGVTPDGWELDRTSLYFDEDGTGSIESSFYGLLEGGLDSEDYYGGDLIEFQGKYYQSMTYGYAGEITYTIAGDTITLEITHYGEYCGKMTLKKSGIDRYTVTAIEGLIMDETITSTIPIGSEFIWF